jgi:hypothetical protein
MRTDNLEQLKKWIDDLIRELNQREEEIKKLRARVKNPCWWDMFPCPYSSGPVGLKDYKALCKECTHWSPETFCAVIDEFPLDLFTTEEKKSEVADALKHQGERLRRELESQMNIFARDFVKLVSEQAKSMMDKTLEKFEN